MGDDNFLVQLQISDLSKEYLENGDLEAWTGSTPDGFTKTEAVSSTVSEETTDVRPGSSGSSCAKFTYDGSANTARINQDITTIKECWLYLKFYYRYEDASAGAFKFRLKDDATNVYLQDDYTWAAGSNDITVPACDAWTYFEIRFLAHPDYDTYSLWIGSGSTVVSKYVLVDDIEFKRDTSFFSIKTTNWNGAQWIGAIPEGQRVSIEKMGAYRGIREQSGVSIPIIDADDSIKNILDDFDTGRVRGKNAIIREEDGTVLGRYIITGTNRSTSKIVEFRLSDAYADLENVTFPPVITEEEFPDAPDTSIGQYIPHFSGQMLAQSGKEGIYDYIICHRKRDRVTSTVPGLYLIGKSIQDIEVYDVSNDFQYAEAPDGTDVTTWCTLITPTATDPYHYISYSSGRADEEYIKINFKYPAISPETMIEEIGELCFTGYTFDLSDISGVLGYSGRHYEKTLGGAQDETDCHFLINSDIKKSDILEWICSTFNLNYYINPNREIVFKYFDFLSIHLPAETKIFQDNVSYGFELKRHGNGNEYTEMYNQANVSYGQIAGSFNRVQEFNSYEGQARWGDVRVEKIKCPFLPSNLGMSKRMAQQTAKINFAERFDGLKELTFSNVPIAEIKDLNIFHILKLKHPDFGNDDWHYVLIRRMRFEYPGQFGEIDCIDVSHWEELDIETQLVIQSNGPDESVKFYDSAPQGYNWVFSNNATVKHDSAYPLFSPTSIAPVASAPDLRVGQYGYLRNIDPFVNLGGLDVQSIDISFWVRFNNSGSVERIIGQWNGANYWSIFKTAADIIRFVIYYPSLVIQMSSTSTVADGKWHHVVLYRDSSDKHGLYIDGPIEAYATTSYAHGFTSRISLMSNASGAQYLDGNLQDVRISCLNGYYVAARAKGVYNCNPDAGLTDKINVPVGLWSIFYGKQYINF